MIVAPLVALVVVAAAAGVAFYKFRRRRSGVADELVDDEENILVKGTNGQWQWKKGHAREKRELTDAATKVQLAHTRLQLSLRE